MAENLKILVTASLNKQLSTNNLKKEITEIEKTLGTLNLDIKFNSKQMSSLVGQLTKLQKQFGLNKFTPTIDTKEIKSGAITVVKDLDAAFSKYKDKGLLTVPQKSFDPVTKELRGFTLEVKRADETIQKLKFDIINLANGDKITKAFKLAGVSESDQSSKIREKALQQEQAIRAKNARSEEEESKKQQKYAQDYERFWLSALKSRETKEQQIKTNQDQKQVKYAQDYEKFWINALNAREKKEQELRESALRSEQSTRRAIDQSIAKEQERTRALQAQLDIFKKQQAINVQESKKRYSGIVDSSGIKIDTRLDDYLRQVNALTVNTPRAQEAMKRFGQELRQINADAKTGANSLDIANKSAISFGNAIQLAATKFALWGVATTAIMQSLNFFRQGIGFVNELNKSLTDLSIVYMKSQDQVAKYAETFHELGMQMSISTSEIAKGAASFARAGLNQTEMMSRMQTAIKYAKISGLDFNSSAEILTATINSMSIDAERAADVFSYLGDSTASGADEIGQAMQRVGGSAGAIGLEFEKTASWIAVVSSKTRESSYTIGNSIKSIIARIQSLKENGFDEEDGTSVNQVSKALSEVGIKLIDAQGNFRNFGLVMDELGAKWSTLSNRQQAYIATTVAGSYQQSRFLNLMSGYSESVDLYKESLDSAGISQKKFDLYQEGTEAKLTRLKNAWSGVWQTSFQSDSINTAIAALTKLATVFDKVVGSTGLLPLITMFGLFSKTVRTFLFSSGGQFYNWMGLTSARMKGLSLDLALFTQRMGVSAGTARVLSVSMIGLMRAVAPLAIIGGIAYGIEQFTAAMMENKKANERATDAIKKNNEAYEDNASQLSSLLDYYKENFSSIHTNIEVKEKLFDIQNKLVSAFGNEASGLDLVNGKYQEQIKLIDSLNKNNLQDKINQNQIAVNSIMDNRYSNPELANGNPLFDLVAPKFQKYTVGDGGGHGNLDIIQFYKELLSLKEKLAVYDESIFASNNLVPKNPDEWLNAQTAINSKLEELKPLYDQIIAQENDRKSLIKSTVDEQLTLTQEQKAQFDEVSKSMSDVPLEKYQSSLLAVSKVIQSGDLSQLQDILTENGVSAENASKVINQYTGSVEDAIDVNTELSNHNKSISDTFKSSADEVKYLNGVISDLTENQSLSADATAELIMKYPELAKLAVKTADGWKIETSAIEELRQAKINKAIEDLESEKKSTLTAIQNTLARIGLYSKEAEAIQTLADAKRVYNGLDSQKQSLPASTPSGKDEAIAWMNIQNMNKGIDEAKTNLQKFMDLSEEAQKLQAIINDPKFGVSSSSSKDKKEKKDKDAPEILDGIQARINTINKEAEARKELNTTYEDRIGELEDDGKYDKAIEKTTTLLKSQQKEVTLLSSANKKLTAERSSLDASTKYNLSSLVDSNGEVTESYTKLYNSLGSKSAQDALQKLVDQYAAYTKAINTNNDAIDAANDKHKDTIKNLEEEKKTRDEAKLEGTNKYLEKISKPIAEFDDQIEESSKRQQLYTEGTAAFNAEQEKQLSLLQQKGTYLQKEIAWVEARLKQGNLTVEQESALNDWLKANKSALLDTAIATKDLAESRDNAYKEWADNVKSAAQDALSTLEDFYKDQADAEKKTLDDSLTAYENYINERKKLLSRQNDTEDFNKNRTKLQKEASDLQTKINVLSLDNSWEAKSKREELEKQLADKLNEITELQTDRDRKLREDNLDDMLDSQQKATEEAKKNVDAKWEYELNKDKYYSNLKESILQGNVNNMQSILLDFSNNTQSYMDAIGRSIDKNVTEKLAATQKFLDIGNQIANNNLSTNPSTGNITFSPTTTNTTPSPNTVQAWQEYLNNKLMAETMGSKAAGFTDLKKRNDLLRALYKFKDGSYLDLSKSNVPIFSAESGGMTPEFTGGKFLLAHEKELVLNKQDTSNVLKIVDWTRNLMSNLKLPDLSKINPAIAGSSGDIIYNITAPVTINGGDKNAGNTFVDSIRKSIRSKGFN